MSELIDWTSKGLTFLVLLLAVLFVAWHCLDGLIKITTIGRGFFNYCRNRHAFDRWFAEATTKQPSKGSP